jgi:hypothetical protein
MPDVVLWTNHAGVLHLALAEAKASTGQDPDRLIEKNVSQFLVDIKTRAHGFTHRYDGYLIASQFCDGGKILCSCLHVDLGWYSKSHERPLEAPQGVYSAVTPDAQPESRLQGLIRLQAETGGARDEYLTSLISEEATRAATLDLILRQKVENVEQVDAHILQVASRLGLATQWDAGQRMIREVKGKEKDQVSKALARFRKPTLQLE